MNNFKSQILKILGNSQNIDDELQNLLSTNGTIVIFYLAKISVEKGSLSKKKINGRLKKLYLSKFFSQNIDQFLNTEYYEIFINLYVYCSQNWETKIIEKYFEKDKAVLLKAIKLASLRNQNSISDFSTNNRDIALELFSELNAFAYFINTHKKLEISLKETFLSKLNMFSLFDFLYVCGEFLSSEANLNQQHSYYFQKLLMLKINTILSSNQIKIESLDEFQFHNFFIRLQCKPKLDQVEGLNLRLISETYLFNFPIDLDGDIFKEFCLNNSFHYNLSDIENQLTLMNSSLSDQKLFKVFVKKFREICECNAEINYVMRYMATIRMVFWYFITSQKNSIVDEIISFMQFLFYLEAGLKIEEDSWRGSKLGNDFKIFSDSSILNVYPSSNLKKNLREAIIDKIVFRIGNDLNRKFLNTYLFEIEDSFFFFPKSSANPFFAFSVIDSLIRISKDSKIETENLASLISSDLEENVSKLFESSKFRVLKNEILCDSDQSTVPKMEIDVMVKDGNTLLILEIKSSSFNGGLFQIFETYHQNLLKAGLQLSNIEKYLNTDLGRDELRNRFGFNEKNLEIKYMVVSNHFNFDGVKIFSKYLKTSYFELETILNDNLYLLYDPIFEISEEERVGILSVENGDSKNFDYYNQLTLERFPALKAKMQEKYKLFDGDKSLINIYKKLEEKVVWRCLNSSQN
ncbi:hypothetical protein ND861_04915 [Leptospira sp. 2 VSF19]|uniref:PD-(D/E)XK nuclease family protein n=1 Tax=Leptospira soteropolitanensis TaxID=2950025 RepID=A0AAW5VIM4_9LEPT|nr:hypothetical protein [Leptospira soteropolitanensis]MCW7491992.1 hypothetical protein [Leptospira soteropolitanensis]MCW7499575.1 hypothetical protein [Leptospira soteropolitanensis]MCW7521826.1 hypothetical protein [Leptospira soteropolitanensis]MCW7525679.1 hypothetical protein [Leptospira soteropolitanensis]MCW7530206.1 hypothetical protein [Leptospira soteropolitanensis]